MKLNDWIAREKITKTYLAMRLNIDRTLIFYWNTGKRRIGPKTLKELTRITDGEVSRIEDVRNE